MDETGAPPNLLPLAVAMTAAERQAYERSCLAELTRRTGNERLSRYRHHQVRDVRLEGSYPDTTICVRWFDARYGSEKEKCYALWISAVTRKPPGFFEHPTGATVGREKPEQVAMLIQAWIEES